MPIIINGPYSGKPVKLRDQDIGRSVRDEEGRTFYVLPRADGSGFYSSPTRQGSAKEEERYDSMASKTQGLAERVKQEHTALHDARGRGQGSWRGKLVILVLLIAVLALAWYGREYLYGMWKSGPPAGNIPTR